MNIKKTTGLSIYIRPPESIIWSDNVDSVVIGNRPIHEYIFIASVLIVLDLCQLYVGPYGF